MGRSAFKSKAHIRTCQILPRMAKIETLLAMCKLLLKENALKITNNKWATSASCVITWQIWPFLDLVRSNQLIFMTRCNISTIVGVITEHCLIGKHAGRLGVQWACKIKLMVGLRTICVYARSFGMAT